MHHIVSDGWSMGVLIREVGALYESYHDGQRSRRCRSWPIQYADYAVWQREWLQGEVLEEQLCTGDSSWRMRRHVLELPTDRPRPAVQSYRGRDGRTSAWPAELSAAT